METEPTTSSIQQLWAKYGKLLMLIELKDTIDTDWTAPGTKLWAERQIEGLKNDGV